MGTTYSLLKGTDHWFVCIENIAEYWVFLFIKFSGIFFFFPGQKAYFHRFFFFQTQASFSILSNTAHLRKKKETAGNTILFLLYWSVKASSKMLNHLPQTKEAGGHYDPFKRSHSIRCPTHAIFSEVEQ